MEFTSVSEQSITFRLGLEFRFPTDAPPVDPSVPSRYLRIQVASPPPDRVDGTPWYSGLRVRGGPQGDRDFVSADFTWQNSGGVFPVIGTSPLRQPSPATLIYDGMVEAPAVPPADALLRCFQLISAEGPSVPPLNHFISVPYPTPSIGANRLDLAGVNYYCEGVLDLLQPIDEYCAVCLITQFYPPGRDSAEYIVTNRVEVPESERTTISSPDPVPGSGPRVW